MLNYRPLYSLGLTHTMMGWWVRKGGTGPGVVSPFPPRGLLPVRPTLNESWSVESANSEREEKEEPVELPSSLPHSNSESLPDSSGKRRHKSDFSPISGGPRLYSKSCTKVQCQSINKSGQ